MVSMAGDNASALDDKVPLIISFLGPILKAFRPSNAGFRPFLFAVSGVQGSGKSTLVARLVAALSSLGYRPVCISVDDCYHPSVVLEGLASGAQTGNKLLQQRGPPGTHDIELADQVLGELRQINEFDDAVTDPDQRRTVKLPSYDKGARRGRGDRRPPTEWTEVRAPVDVVILEGWCVGFQHRPEDEVRDCLRTAQGQIGDTASGKSLLGPSVLLEHDIEHLLYSNACLARSCRGFMDPGSFDALVHLDAEDLSYVYRWRLQQEHQLRKDTGQGMNDEDVELFVLRYMPAYVLYLDQLRQGVVSRGRQLQIVMGPAREVVKTRKL